MNTNNNENHDSTPEPALLPELRARLNLIIAARQSGQAAQIPGPKLVSYCLALADCPDNTLGHELAAPLMAILRQLASLNSTCESLLRQDESSPELQDSAKRVLHQIDVAYGLVLRNLNHPVSYCAEVTEDTDLLCEFLYAQTRAGRSIARLLRRYQKHQPTEVEPEEGGCIGAFAWDVCQRVAALERLAAEFPDHIRVAARRMTAWPMLQYRHHDHQPRFQQLASRLELGADSPADSTSQAQFQPDDPMVQYLLHWLDRLCQFRRDTAYLKNASPEHENRWLPGDWCHGPNDWLDDETLQVLRAVRQLPPLTKATAAQWSEAIVALILATDASDYRRCADPALQAIARQKGVKSRNTFETRLRSAVTATILQLARPK